MRRGIVDIKSYGEFMEQHDFIEITATNEKDLSKSIANIVNMHVPTKPSPSTSLPLPCQMQQDQLYHAAIPSPSAFALCAASSFALILIAK